MGEESQAEQAWIIDPRGRLVSRRKVIGLLAGTAVATDALLRDPLDLRSFLPFDLAAATLPPVAPPASLLLARQGDGLLLSLSFANIDIQPRRRLVSQLVLRDKTKPGYVMVGFPNQSVFEETFADETADGKNPPHPGPTEVIRANAAGPSRVVVMLPVGSAPVNFDAPSLLNLGQFPLSVNPRANSGGSAVPTLRPETNETAIEAPWRLTLSPPGTALFASVGSPVTRNGRTELWHARVVGGRLNGLPDQRPHSVPLRAIWSEDLPGGTPLPNPEWTDDNKKASLLKGERVAIVENTTVDLPGDPSAPANASLLLVSPMGASLDALAQWPKRGVIQWRHRSWLGRDNYVRVDIAGFLFPFGFPAVLTKISDRFRASDGAAFLRKREFITVRIPTVTYGGAVGQHVQGRNLPFKAAETTTLVTPPLVFTREALGAGEWVQVNDANGVRQDLRFKLVLTDWDGKRSTADLPLAFVPRPNIGLGPSSPANLASTVTAYNTQPETRRTLALNGQKVAFVPTPPNATEDPSLPAFNLLLESETATTDTPDALAAFPKMKTSQVSIEVLDAVNPTAVAAGVGALAAPTHQTIEFPSVYTDNGLGGAANLNEVWARITDLEKPALGVPQQLAGGMAAPSIAVEGLSMAHGPVSDFAKLEAPTDPLNNFDPSSYFDLGVTLLGGIKLSDVIPVIPFPDPRSGDAKDSLPKVTTNKVGNTMETVITWRPELKEFAVFQPAIKPDSATNDKRLDLKAVFRTDLTTGQSSALVTGELRNFALNFVEKEPSTLAFIRQEVRRLRFESRDGAKPSLDVQLGKSEFLGQLKFLVKLQDLIPALPGGVKINATPSGISADLSIAIPTVGVGVLLIENLAIVVGLEIPFTGEQTTLGFGFSSREHPFHLTVSGLGGGGFLRILLGMRGVQGFEGALEFGAAVAIDLGVASGSVSIMAGIYFQFKQLQGSDGKPAVPAGNSVVITGYVRAIGELDVLGLIHVSIEFYLGLTYADDGGAKRVEGVARVTVRVEVLFFSESVSVEMKKEFGAGKDPFFGDQITQGDWNTYCDAFA